MPKGKEALIVSAVENRASLRGAALATRIEEEWVDEVDARFWPQVFAQAQGVLQRETAFGGDNFRWTLSLQASWDLYDGGFRDVERSQHEISSIQRGLQEELDVRQVESEVRQAWLAMLAERRTVQNAGGEVDLAIENLELTRAARELDAATAVDLELAQRQRFLAEVALASAEVQLQARVYELCRLAGRW